MTGKSVLSAVLIKQAQLTRYILMGEVHDNPDHHVIQANLIETIASARRRPSVVFEMVPRSLAMEISRYDLASDSALDEFAKKLRWEERGWYSWDIYRPVALAAARNRLPMIAGDLDRTLLRAISKNGWTALTTEQIDDFAINSNLPSQLEAELLNILDSSHCGMMPSTVLPSMLKVQRARDGSMADAMVKSPASGSALF